jgi:hypothetical protein
MEIELMKALVTALAVAAGLTLGAGAATAAPVSIPGSAALNGQGSFTLAQYYGGGYGGGYGYRRPYCRNVQHCSGYGYYRRCWYERVCH